MAYKFFVKLSQFRQLSGQFRHLGLALGYIFHIAIRRFVSLDIIRMQDILAAGRLYVNRTVFFIQLTIYVSSS
jgi:hypothetical protein